MRYVIITIILVFPSYASASGVIGGESLIAVNSFPFINSDPNPEYAAVFNYFCTLEIVFGLFALFLRLTIRPFRM